MLLQLHAIALIEQKPGQCRGFLESVYQQNLFLDNSNLGGHVKSITANCSLFPPLKKDFHLVPPRFGGISSKDIPILPLFDVLGVDRFFKLLSAVMLERRIIFIAEDVDTLSSAVLAAASMLHPFNWHHIFIPLLPAKLLSYVSAPMPFMIGIRKYLLTELRKEPLDSVLIVDVDTGDIQAYGNVPIHDLIGDSGTALKQASEQLDRVYAKATGMANMLLGKSSGSKSSSGGSGGSGEESKPRDLMAMILNDIKSGIVANKPGSGSIQSVATNLLRGLPGAARSMEESRITWTLESEKTLRDCLAHFFVYLFGDLDDFIRMGGGNSAARGKTEKFAEGDPRANFDLTGFSYRRNQMGDSKLIQDFLGEFMHSQMFERFCDERIRKIQLQKAENRTQAGSGSRSSGFSLAFAKDAAASPSSQEDQDDLFEGACQELKLRQSTNTVVHARQAVHARSNSSASSSTSEAAVAKMIGTNFHPFTLQYTSSSNASSEVTEGEGAADLDGSTYGNAAVSMQERVIGDAYFSDSFVKIMNTITFRLETCRVSACRGAPGASGIRALALLRSLLISGPECVLSHALELIPTIRQIIKICSAGKQQQQSGQNQLASQALEFMSIGPLIDSRMQGRAVLALLLDQKKLVIQQKFDKMRREGYFGFLTAAGKSRKPSTEATPFTSRAFPLVNFRAVHQQVNVLNLAPIAEGVVQITPPELLVAHHVEEEGDDDEGPTTTSNSGAAVSDKPRPASSTPTPAAASHHLADPMRPFSGQGKSITPAPTAAGRPGTVSPKRNSVTTASPAPVSVPAVAAPKNTSDSSRVSPANAASSNNDRATPKQSAAAVADLLDFTEDDKYRVVNKDTGEFMDIRDIAKYPQPIHAFVAHDHPIPPPRAAAPARLPPPAGTKPKPISSASFTAATADPWAVPVPAAKPAPAFDPFGQSTPFDTFAPTPATQPAFAPSTGTQFAPSPQHQQPPANPFATSQNAWASMPPSAPATQPIQVRSIPGPAANPAVKPKPKDPFADLLQFK